MSPIQYRLDVFARRLPKYESTRVQSIAMPKAGKRKREEPLQTLKGWKAIGEYLGIGASTAQRWAKGGMPVKRHGRYMAADANEIRQWLGREAHMPGAAHVVTDTGDDISAALKESISALRRTKRKR